MVKSEEKMWLFMPKSILSKVKGLRFANKSLSRRESFLFSSLFSFLCFFYYLRTPCGLSFPIFSVKGAKLYRLGDVSRFHLLGACKIRNSPRYAEDAVVGAG